MTSAMRTAHIHVLAPDHPNAIVNGVQLGTCDCGIKVCRQIPPPGALTVAIPRDWDTAHEEAAAELAAAAAPEINGRALLAERYGADVVAPEVITPWPMSDRARSIAGIHALADFFASHPEVPMPRTVTANAAVANVLELEALAEALGERIYGPDERPQFDHTVQSWGLATWAQFIVSIQSDARPL